MALELVFLGAATSVAALVMWGLAAIRGLLRPARMTERAAFWAAVGPTLGAALVFAFFVGWALQEPDPSDEWIDHGLFLITGAAGLVAIRAGLRALASLFARESVPVGTVGLLRPRIRVCREFRDAVDEETLRSAIAHEEAHRRHRDPLRIWLLALASDLAWPIPGARARFERWLTALEMARDDEALAHGATPGGLVSAILIAARLSSTASRTSAAMAGTQNGFATRVRRLLSGDARAHTPRRTHATSTLVGAALFVACGLGYVWGDALLGVLPGVGR